MVIGIDIRNIGRKRTGDETVFFQLVKHLARIKEDKNHYLLFLDERSPEEIQTIAERLGVAGNDRFRCVSLKARGKFDWNLFVLPRYLRKHAVDVYHTQYIVPFFVPKRTKIVTHIHDISFRAHPEFIRWQDRFFLNTLIPWSVKRADAVIAVSEFTKQELCRAYGVPERKVSVVYNALGEDFLENKPNQEAIVVVKEKYALPDRFMLYVGTLQPRKNIPMLIRAYAGIQERLGGIGLVIAGNLSGHNVDPGIKRATSEAGLDGRVVFPGYIDQADLPTLMRAAHLFVYPSLYEGFGIPLLEAMSQETPVMASDIPCLREVAREAAFFASPKDLAQFSENLYNACIDSEARQHMISRANERLRIFSWEKSARQLRTLYESFRP